MNYRLASVPHVLATCLLLLAMAPSAFAQSGTIRGTVTDATDGEPLAGANVLVIDSAGEMVTGAATNVDGMYTIANVPAGSYTLRGRFVGYQELEQAVTVSGGGTVTADLALSQEGFELNTVVVTGSRRAEKVLDAPASISVLTTEDVAQDIGTSSIEALRTTPGVDMAQTGVDRREVVLRGFNNAFSGATYVLTDYRAAAVASLAVNIYSIMPNINVDVDRIEVVRGPGSALYGAGVDAGVVHFITKDPFSHPGTTVSVSGGERSYLGLQFRHAGVLGEAGKFGYKITGAYGQADDWEMDPNDPIDEVQLRGDVEPRTTDYEKYNVNLNAEYRVSDKTSIIANAGTSALTATVLSGIGTLQAEGFGYSYGQLRLQSGNFFAQTYVNMNKAGDSFVYDQDFNGDGVADPVTDNGMQLSFQAQYDMDLGQKQKLIVGLDADLTRPDTEGTILGRNEENDDIDEYGVYVQSQTAVTPKLDLVLALRGDYNNVVDEYQVSPRAGIVFKATRDHSFRATYNRAFSSPGTNSNFLDIIAASSPLTVRGRGSGFGFTWDRNPAYSAFAINDLVATSLLPNRLGQPTAVGADLDAVYELVYAGLAATPSASLLAVLQSQGILAGVPAAQGTAIVDGLKQLLNPAVTPVTGFSPGLLGMLNLTTGVPDKFVNDLEDIEPLSQTITQTFEVGYKGVLGNKLLFTVDGYYTTKENFIGPLLLETPLVLPVSLEADLTAALTEGIANNPILTGQLAQLGLNGAAVAGLVVGIAAPDLPSAVGIVQPAQNNPGVGVAPELMLTYKNFGKVDYYGVDVAFEYLASDQLSVFGNLSIVSDDFFDNEELDEENEALTLALNASTFKGRLGAKYRTSSGLSFNGSFRYTEGFPVQSGPYVGDLPSYSLIDVGVGYDLSASVPGLSVNVGINNVTNNEHRQFIGAPQLGRMAIARVTYSF